MTIKESIPIIVALIAAALSLITALLSAYLASRTKKLESELADMKAEKDARRDYEYEARKHLYKQCEPLWFQLVEYSESALKHISQLATAAKEGRLGPGKTLFADPKGYYTASTVYKLISPIVIYRLIQRRLTLFDLDLDSDIKTRYLLAKQLYVTFTEHWEFAAIEPTIDYAPESNVSVHDQKKHPEKYYRQGVSEGWLDTMLDSLVKSEPDGSLRCATYGEFKAVHDTKYSKDKTFSVADLFFEFHPKSRPVLWRILITQAHLYEALIRTRGMRLFQLDKNKRVLMTITGKDKFDWRRSKDETTDEKVLIEPFAVAQKYLRQHLENLF